jgi:hypothetical protein
MTTKRGYWKVEGRWEHTHDSPNAESYFPIDEIGGSLADAQQSAQDYFNRLSGQTHSKLEWATGSAAGRTAYYACTPAITIRITD